MADKNYRMQKAATNKLRILCRLLSEAGETELSDKLLCALGAITGSKEPKADVSYSSMMRDLRKEKADEKRIAFQKTFKTAFDEAVESGLDAPDNIALMAALQAIGGDK